LPNDIEEHMDDVQHSRSRPGYGSATLPVGSAATTVGGAKPHRYTIADLERETGISPRNIRYYITQGLLPPANGRGVGATYSAEHLLRLQYINKLKQDNVPLAEMRKLMEGLTQEKLADVLRVETAPPQDRWRRIHLHDDIELHVRERAGRDRDYDLERAVEEIAGHAEIVLAKLGNRA
jgi:DNA-binding transcriptional MerR regulator